MRLFMIDEVYHEWSDSRTLNECDAILLSALFVTACR